MDKNCGSCTYLDLSTGDLSGKYYCKKKYDRHLATDNVCYSYTKAYSRSSGEYNNAIDYSKNKGIVALIFENGEQYQFEYAEVIY